VDAEAIQDLFREFGPVQVRRMFGGAGLYAGGVMFALVSDELIYLKTDAASLPAFERERCAPFEYDTKAGKRALTTYWRLPERLYDDPDELAQWARAALAAARAQESTPKRSRGKLKPPARSQRRS
jgi:DNA transformation protein and related proteins